MIDSVALIWPETSSAGHDHGEKGVIFPLDIALLNPSNHLDAC